MKKNFKKFASLTAFSLAEVIVSLAIGVLVLVAVLAVYSRAQRSAVAINRNLDSQRLASEILQRIAEDLDGIIESSKDVRITVRNKVESHGYYSARLEILKTVYNDALKPQDFEKIIWQGAFDYDGDSRALVLYRSRSGIAYEDKLLDEEKEDFQRELFVPVCAGVTFFSIQVNDQLMENWTKDTLPKGITVFLSFAEPLNKNVAGAIDVPEWEKIKRTVAIDRTRKLNFVYEPPEYEDSNQPTEDPNKLTQQPQTTDKTDEGANVIPEMPK